MIVFISHFSAYIVLLWWIGVEHGKEGGVGGVSACCILG